MLMCLLKVEMAMGIPKPFVSTSITCYTYQKIDGQLRKGIMDDCMFGNACCYNAEFIGKLIFIYLKIINKLAIEI